MKYIFLVFFSVVIISSCKNDYTVDQHLKEEVVIVPDYKNITVPYNIAPLNFSVKGEKLSFVKYEVDDHSLVVKASNNQTSVPIKEWHDFLQQAKGKSVNVTVVVDRKGNQVAFAPFSIEVSTDVIDEYIAYRLIEPGYEIWNQMGIYQRNLTNFDQSVIIENTSTGNNCMNCHSFCNWNSRHYMFHMRSTYGGTVIVDEDQIDFIDTKVKETISPLVYPYWHPSGNYIAFSTNKTSQGFHPTQRVEVFDKASDVIVYNVKEHLIISSPRIAQDGAYETFPAFSPDGKFLYFCSAKAKSVPDSIQNLKYNLCRIPFDEGSGHFGKTIDTLFFADKENKSFSFPRISPDGRYLLGTVSAYGTFPIWHKDADLYVIDLHSGVGRYAENVNSFDTESYHSWSSSGRWVIFSSRRMDGLYTRPYIAHFSADGRFGKPFLLPQKDVCYYQTLLKSYNIPEFITGKVDNNSLSIYRRVQQKENKSRFQIVD